MASSSTKKLINDADRCVDEALEGLVAVTPGITKLRGHRVIVRDDIKEVKRSGKVTLLSGGGAGHEPAHAGFVGQGMLSGAVVGSVFASPPTSSILAAIQAVSKGNAAGTLLIVKNYTGDCLNFGIAMERARAAGLLVDIVVVRDDCALAGQDLNDRRGLAGTIFIHKLAGAMAENGDSLSDIKAAVQQASTSLGTIGVCLYPCSVPGAGPSFHLGPQEIGLGLGIHGEAGVKKLQLTSANDLVSTMLDHMMSPTNNCRLECKRGDRIALMVNNLGGTSNIELCIVARAALRHLAEMGVEVERVYCGTFMTSLEMQGVSLTILHLNGDGQRIRCLDQATSASSWPAICHRHGNLSLGSELEADVAIQADNAGHVTPKESGSVNTEAYQRLKVILRAVCEKLIANEQLLNELDTSSGDGDCGTTLRRGAQAIQQWLNEESSPLSASDLVIQLSILTEQAMGGSSGAFYSLFLLGAQEALVSEPGLPEWVNALKLGMMSIMKHGKANVGDRTMLDPIDAALKVLQAGATHKKDPVETFSDAVQAAESSAESTAKMAAKAGRARYVDPDQLGRPDPGAVAVSIWLRAALEALKAL